MNVDFFMKEAIIEADKAYNLNEVPVGGILVDNKTKKIVARSYNTVNKNKKAHYIMLIIESNPDKIDEYERKLRLHEDVIRFMTIKIKNIEIERGLHSSCSS